MKKLLASVLLLATTGAAWADITSTASVTLNISVLNADGSFGQLTLANDPGFGSGGLIDVHEWWYGPATFEQHFRQDGSDMNGANLRLLDVPGTDMQGSASAPVGYTGTWTSSATSNTAQSIITADSTGGFFFMVLPGQTVSISAYLYAHSASEGHNLPISYPVIYQRGTASVMFFVGSLGDAKSAMAGDGYTNLDEQTNTITTSIYNGSSEAIRQVISYSTDVNISNTETTADITPVPEPSTWLLMGLGLLVTGYKLERRDQAAGATAA